MKNSLKCKSCGTVNWGTASECVRCKTALAEPASDAGRKIELPPSVVEVLAMTHDHSRPKFSRYLTGAVVVILVLSAGFYALSETVGFDKESKTSLFTRLYWGRRPPSAEFLTKSFETRLKCEREYKKIYQPASLNVPAVHGPCLRGELPFGYRDIPQLREIEKCGELPKVVTPESGESESVDVLKTEVIEGRFEKNPPIDPNGAKNGHPEKSATIFFRAIAKMDYIHRRDTWGVIVEDHERDAVSENRTLLLYWDDKAFRGCRLKIVPTCDSG